MGIYKRGKVYWARWDEDGKQHRRSLGTKRRSEAEKLFDELLAQGPDRLTVREILRLWLKHQTPRCKTRSIEIYGIAVKRFSMVWGDLYPEDINTLLVERFQDNSIILGLSPRTINQQVGNVRSAFTWAHDRELIQVGFPKWTKLKLRESHSRKYLTAFELEKLLATLRQPRWERLSPFIMLALYAGLHQQEINWLMWDDLDLEEGWIHVRPKKGWSPKSSSSNRSVPIADELSDYLTNMPRTCRRWVAPFKPGKQWVKQHLGHETRCLFKAAGVDDGGPFCLHRLRGVFAVAVLRGGGDLESLKGLLGHSSIAQVSQYLASTSQSKQRAVSGLSFNGS